MTWYAYLRRMAIELAIFFPSCVIIFYVFGERDSLAGAINMALLATIGYGGITFVLRQRAIRKQDDR